VKPRTIARPAEPREDEPRGPRTVPLRWVAIAALALLGMFLGAGARAMRQSPDVAAPAPPAPVSQR
jgi:hypothetical protein